MLLNELTVMQEKHSILCMVLFTEPDNFLVTSIITSAMNGDNLNFGSPFVCCEVFYNIPNDLSVK